MELIRDGGKSIYLFQAMKSLQFQKHGFRESTSSSSFQFPMANNTVVYACVLRRKGFSWTIQDPNPGLNAGPNSSPQ
jgi:hypothetical protein